MKAKRCPTRKARVRKARVPRTSSRYSSISEPIPPTKAGGNDSSDTQAGHPLQGHEAVACWHAHCNTTRIAVVAPAMRGWLYCLMTRLCLLAVDANYEDWPNRLGDKQAPWCQAVGNPRGFLAVAGD